MEKQAIVIYGRRRITCEGHKTRRETVLWEKIGGTAYGLGICHGRAIYSFPPEAIRPLISALQTREAELVTAGYLESEP